MRHLILSLATTATLITASAETPLWLRDVQISPDGQQIAFTYMGDIFTVPVAGGKARQLTTQTSYETSPIWSPDSKSIAFASDRHGNMDIYVMSADGGTARRLTSVSAAETPEAFSPDGKEIYFSANIQAPAESSMFPSGRMTQLYAVKVDGSQAPRQVLGTPAQAISFVPGTNSFIYQDIKGFEDQWRKHHTSSVTRDIWLYDASTGTHTNLTNRPGEDRNGVMSADGHSFTFLSERDGGTFNVYRASLDNPSKVEALTSLKTHPVRFLSQAVDGTLAFGYDGEIYTLVPGKKPKKVAVDVTIDRPDDDAWIRVMARSGVPSPNGEQVAFASRGNVFVTSAEYESTKQITDTPAEECQISWSPDGDTLVYTSMRDGHFNIYKATRAREDDPNFSNATIITEEPVVAVDNVERTYPHFSPDGKQLAFIQDRNKLMVMDVDTKRVRQLTDGSTYSYRDGGFDYEWSPDSKWIVFEDMGNHHAPYTDISIINVATGELTNLTNSGYTDRAPHFVMGGNAIVFLSERYGMRNHASWGSLDDAMIIFLNRDAYDKYSLSEEDYALLKEVEKANKKKAAKKDAEKSDDKKADNASDTKGNDGDKADKDAKADKSTDIVVELDGIADRTLRLTPFSSNMADAWVDNDGENLYFLAATDKDLDLWKMGMRDGSPSIANKIGAKGASMIAQADGSALWIVGDKVRKYELKGGKLKTITASGNALLNPAAEREAMFDQVYVSEREMFYDKKMHGVDWDALCSHYRRFLPHINNNYDFAEMLSELLGELNVSHTGASYRGNEANSAADRSASLGLLYDMAYTGNGARVVEIITDGPFDTASTRMEPGSTVTAINGVEVTPLNDISVILNNLNGKKTLVAFTTPSGEQVEEVVIPITSAQQLALLYDRWVKQRADYVDRISGGRLGYVHIKSMDDASFRKVYSDALGKYIDRDGLVIDIRWNGGGRLHEDIEVLFSGEKYFTQVIRGEQHCDMPSRRYNKPTIMVIAEPCYSNAHGTPWVYKHQGLGKLVGMPVPGTMTSVNWVRLQDNSITFGIPVVGYQLPDGSYLENTQLEPDFRVANSPESIVRGDDDQLRVAVEQLLRQIDGK